MIRQAIVSDIFEIKSLERDYRASYLRLHDHDVPEAALDFRDAVKKHRLFVMRMKEIIAFIVCYPDNGVYCIDALHVDYPQRGRGFARQLLSFAETRAHDTKCGRIALWIDPIMQPHIDFFKSQGFHVVAHHLVQGHERAQFEL